MLAGLIFAIEEANDRPGTLVATLPFGGMTLLEYQIRLLVGAGAEQVLVAVGKMTPALLAAVNRAGRREVNVEIVRSAEEAAEKIADDSRVLVMADGLVTTDPVVDRMGHEGPEALLVTDDAGSPAAIERLDMRDSWAGVARISVAQLRQIAQMPEDYDFQSALLRVAAQSGAAHVPLTASWLRGGHAVEHSASGLAARNTGVLAALTERRVDWADRWVFTRIARKALPELVSRNVPAWGLIGGGGLLGLLSLSAIGFGWEGSGLVLSLLAAAVLATSGAMAALRGEERRAQGIEWALLALFGGVALGCGWIERVRLDTTTPLVLAIVALAAQFLVERAPSRHRRWWASPSAHLLLLTPFAFTGFVQFGLRAVAIYAFVTLAAAIEGTREKA
ncbi:hypothetical protein RZN05_06600 [Sphingomonas sp. HF-S4]|uniref:MobA-like NTP transferase domain-containing protein n=1 Tax=Sphingomonas agrestis TaxID=3080540 RepID=A0ABU3Y5M3_9SPHN|nr:hypothetical protein [Sphingomonas sp. HF-S4]MDV3456650.1 hypothetical protein [Sphingomonas sp. HF-S4]